MKLAQKIALTYFRVRLHVIAAFSIRLAAEQAFQLFCTPIRKAKYRKPPLVFEKGESLSFTTEYARISGHRWNHPAQNKVLIIHGFESTSKNFDRYVVPLINDGCEVIAFDAPAHGDSTGRQINLPMYVDMIAQIDNRYGPINGFISHSYGGLALTHFLETLPDQEHRKAVLIAPATETTSAIDSFFSILKLPERVRAEFDKIIFEKGGQWPSHYSVRRAMRHIGCPVLWFHDEDDDLTPLKDAVRVRDDLHARLEFVITRGLGHRRIYRDNQVVKKVIAFLSAGTDDEA